MERNANYALVGVLSTVLFFGLLAFVIWLANLNLNQSYDKYDIEFKGPVRGLSQGGEVHFNGIKVGEVKTIKLDPKDPSMVVARIQVTSDVPIRKDSVAGLEPLGITGVNYVQITAGTATLPLLKDTVPPGTVPQLKSQRDAISDLLAGGGNVLSRAIEALDRVNRVLSDENIKRFSATMNDIQSVTAELRERKSVIADAQKALQDADTAVIQIRELARSGQVLVDGDGRRVMGKLASAADEIEGAAKDLRALMAKLQGPAGDFATNGLPQITSAVTSLKQATEDLDRVIGEVEQNPSAFVGKPPAKEVEVKP